jgi:hypothetical protein
MRNLDNPRNEPWIGLHVLNARIRSLTGDHVSIGVTLHAAQIRQSRDALEHAYRVVPDTHEVAQEQKQIGAACGLDVIENGIERDWMPWISDSTASRTPRQRCFRRGVIAAGR